MPATQCRAWMGTAFGELVLPEELFTYYVYQIEKCPDTDRLHKQFFLYFKKKMTLSGVKLIIGNHHLECARNMADCRKYCMKEETRVEGPFEFGEFSSMKIEGNVVEMCKTQKVEDILQENPKLWRATRHLRDVRLLFSTPRDCVTKALLLTGPTGSGKTRLAVEIASLYPAAFWAAPDLRWFDGYDDHPLMIVDEFRGQVPVSFLLRLIDRTPLILPVKGSFVQMRSELVIFTSNLCLMHLYPDMDPLTMEALKRRIIEINVL